MVDTTSVVLPTKYIHRLPAFLLKVPHTQIQEGILSSLPSQAHRWHRMSRLYRLSSSYGLFRR